MSLHFGFVSTELAPLTHGGAGRLVADISDLLRSDGHRVTDVVASASDRAGVDAAAPDVVWFSGGDDAGWRLPFMAESKAAAEALASAHAADPFDAIEFQDFDGLAFWALTHRGDLGIAEIPVTVRFHGPVDLQVAAMGVSTDELDAVSVMEREVFTMADRVVVPSDGIRELVTLRYGVDRDRVVVGPPPVRSLAHGHRWRPGGRDFVVVGRLAEVKGTHDMVDAIASVLDRHADVGVVFIGEDGWSATENRPMSEMLSARIGPEHRSRVRFVGRLDGADLVDRLTTCLAVVVPSRFESFHLGVHEARRLGAPVIVPDLPAFTGVLDESAGAIVYPSGLDGLRAALERAATDPAAMEALASAAPPEVGDPLRPYVGPLAEPRHLRSQGGLATAALARLEDAWLVPLRASEEARTARRVMAAVPEPVRRALAPLLPASLKDRLKARTNWDVAQQQADWEERWQRVVDASAGGRLPEVPAPRYSVVIPCYNQGEFVRQALVSIYEQTEPSFEVVIVDDGSDDPTKDVLRSIDLPRVRIVTQENRGLPAARNAGIAVARAPYVVTLDADDLLAPTFAERMAGALDTHPDAAFAHCWAELFGDFQAIWATRPYNAYQLCLSNSVVGCVMVRVDAWHAVGGYDESMRSGNEDWDLWLRLMDAGWGEVQVREPLFRYRKHGVSMSVETESAYESALGDLPKRLPQLYRRERLRELKDRHYPLLTVISDDQRWAEVDDFHVVVPGGPPSTEILGQVTGKYAVALSGDADVSLDDLREMCLALERDDTIGAVESKASSPVRVIRTWSVFDEAAPRAIITIDSAATSSIALEHGSALRPDWSVPVEIDGIRVERQRPEEAGIIPEWVPA